MGSVTAAAYTMILAIDLGKFKSVCCVMEVASGRAAREHMFITLETSPQAIRDLVAERGSSDPHSTLVVFESCDAAGWVHDLLRPLKVSIAVVNANDERWRWRKVKRKTDKDDALKLASLAMMDQLPTVHMPASDQRQRRRLMVHRRSVVNRRTISRNSIRSIYSQQGLPLPRGQKLWTKMGMKQLREDTKLLGDCSIDELWKGRLLIELQLIEAIDVQLKLIDLKLDELADAKTKLLQTVKGVGPRLSEAVVLYIDDPKRFKSSQQVASFAGLVPKQFESGEMSRKGHITHRGPSLLRSLLVEAAWTVYRCNDWAKTFVQKISGGGRGRRKLAIVALARRLLIILWAMLKHGTPFRPPGTTIPATQ